MSTDTHVLASRLRVLAAAALFSSGGAAIKAASLNAWQVAGFRSVVAAAALFLMLPEARRRPPLKVLLVGLAYALTMILFVLSNKLTTSASAIFLQSTAPLWVLLLSPWLIGERVSRADLVYMGVLSLGLASFFVGLDPVSATAPNPALGNVLAVLSGVTWAVTIMGLRAMGRGGSDWSSASAVWGNVIAALICLPLALPVEASRPVDWLVILYLGVFQIALAYVFLLRGLRQVPALEASLLLLLEPVLNPIWAWMAHGERPGGWSIAGGVLILLATLARSAWDARRSGHGVSRSSTDGTRSG
ncbi:MAG TPA: EamA family transporter [Thermoanaerobaculia bacterium]|nr:EamA family transporter [Thermoanaerobaculia bacterium]